jgi:hypothetical protein
MNTRYTCSQNIRKLSWTQSKRFFILEIGIFYCDTAVVDLLLLLVVVGIGLLILKIKYIVTISRTVSTLPILVIFSSLKKRYT